MRKAFQRAGWALLTAGGFGWTAMAPAQAPKSLPGGQTGYAVHTTIVRDTAPALTEAGARLEEIKVELAWLGDGATFAYHLAAKVEGPSLAVKGYVPNAGVRDLALKIAEKNTSLQVVDGTKVLPNLSLRQTGVPVETIIENCRQALAEELGGKSGEFAVQARTSGQVTVQGVVASHEEKLAVSRCLRKANGCLCVVNQVRVTPTTQNGKTVVQVMKDGSLVVPGPAAPAPAATVARETKPASAPMMLPAKVAKEGPKPLPAPVPIPLPAKVVKQQPKPLPLPAPITTTVNEGKPALMTFAEPVAKEVKPAPTKVAFPAVKASKPVPLTPPSTVAAEPKPVLPPLPKTDIPLPPPVPVTAKAPETRPAPVWTAPEKKETLAPVWVAPEKKPTPAPTAAVPAAEPKFQAPRQLPTAVRTAPAAVPTAKGPAVASITKTKEPGDPYVATGMMTFDTGRSVSLPTARTPLAPRAESTRPAPKMTAPAPAPTKTTVAAAEPVKLTPPPLPEPVPMVPPQVPSTVQFAAPPLPEPLKVTPVEPVKAATPIVPEPVLMVPPPLPEPVKAPASPAQAAKVTAQPTVATRLPTPTPLLSVVQVKRSIETVCGPAARDVNVRLEPDDSVEISLKVRTADEGHALSTKILGLTELVPFKVSLNMEVAP